MTSTIPTTEKSSNKIMPVENFLERMNTLVEELKAHPKITLLNYHVPAPATEQDFVDVEAHIGFPLPEDTKAFYRLCNGLQLRWIRKDSEYYIPRLHEQFVPGPFSYGDVLDDNMGMDGCVNILPVKEVFTTNVIDRFGRDQFAKDSDILEMNGKGLRYLEFVDRVKLFDLFSAVYDFAFLITEDQVVVVNGCMDHTVFNCSRALSMSQYLELVLESKGDINPRIAAVETIDPQSTFEYH